MGDNSNFLLRRPASESMSAKDRGSSTVHTVEEYNEFVFDG